MDKGKVALWTIAGISVANLIWGDELITRPWAFLVALACFLGAIALVLWIVKPWQKH